MSANQKFQHLSFSVPLDGEVLLTLGFAIPATSAHLLFHQGAEVLVQQSDERALALTGVRMNQDPISGTKHFLFEGRVVMPAAQTTANAA